ncbi:MAG: hypothetical protein CO113_15415 [Elusimicrobia bacterium CG_4_9_14_3_um_filter_62_55]|nr:MAG: hypothetical protein COR54_08655 [Elusimicrobia bacterium CG22_combo_CG10-13_8_21_14_all_63_91]PJA11453.1 MAG: hypothetical protein COX66_19835 [Elusimicrobia bacterium CG_4_10_14_0_2_um_filter_63_34]PJB24160.1 MAG: hypothetical protein CO113_15415 [Elusimicrobia bacterium CG_4_9_14_3_um_filter_62_55]
MISTFDKAVFLRDIDIFSSVKTEELLRIAEISTEVCFDAGHPLFSEGDPGDSLFFVTEGRVELKTRGKTEFTVEGKGSVGSYALLTQSPRYFTAVAAERTCALRIPALEFMDMLSENGEIAVSMLRHLALKVVDKWT